MTLDEAIERYTSNAEYERKHGNLQGCLEFKQLAEWLKELRVYKSRKGLFPADCEMGEFLRNVAKLQPCEDAISRKQALDAFGLSEKTRKYGGDHSGYETIMLYEVQKIVEDLPPVSTEKPNMRDEDKLYFEYMRGYDKGKESVKPCEDAISRSEAIRIASGYCHWTNIPAELAKLPSVTPKQCEDVISREWLKTAIHNFYYGLKHIPTEEDIQAYIDAAPSVSTEKTGRWEWVQYDCNPNIGNWHCSECKNIVFQGVEKKGLHKEVIYKFCPWCGARMIKPQESEE